MSSDTIDWQLNSFRGAPEAAASACIASLDHPDMAVLCGLEPTSEDIMDRARPAATGRSHFLRRRSFLRSVTGLRTGRNPASIVIAYDPDGAPRLVHQDVTLWVSTAGRGSIAAVACADRPVGIDVEVIDPTLVPIHDVLHPFESAVLRTMDDAARARNFLRIWTMKEAYLKARRTGFRREASEIAILQPGDGEIRIEDAGRHVPCTAEWREASVDGRDILAACVALRQG